MCTPGHPSDTCLYRFLPSIRQMLKQDPADPNNPKGTDIFLFAAASTEAPMIYFSRKTVIVPSNNFLQSLTIFPTAMALISVPSLTSVITIHGFGFTMHIDFIFFCSNDIRVGFFVVQKSINKMPYVIFRNVGFTVSICFKII